jgi:ADP-ribose pyrophosphatase YjhB (NUDIX family)
MKEVSCGIAFIYNNQILLVHPTNGKWYGSYGIPKGHKEKNESSEDTAIREVYEEIGVKVKKSKLGKKYTLTYITTGKILEYFIYELNDLAEIGLESIRIPKGQLQIKEVDWCGFISKDEALKRINKNQLDILKFLK